MTRNAFTNAPANQLTSELIVLGQQDTRTPDNLFNGNTQYDHLLSNATYDGGQ